MKRIKQWAFDNFGFSIPILVAIALLIWKLLSVEAPVHAPAPEDKLNSETTTAK